MAKVDKPALINALLETLDKSKKSGTIWKNIYRYNEDITKQYRKKSKLLVPEFGGGFYYRRGGKIYLGDQAMKLRNSVLVNYIPKDVLPIMNQAYKNPRRVKYINISPVDDKSTFNIIMKLIRRELNKFPTKPFKIRLKNLKNWNKNFQLVIEPPYWYLPEEMFEVEVTWTIRDINNLIELLKLDIDASDRKVKLVQN